jgi:hypothetical protein
MSSTNDKNSSNQSNSGGTKKRKSSTSASSTDTSASNTGNSVGFNATNAQLRSILIHPIGLMLASILNEVSLSTVFLDHWTDCCTGLNKWKELLICKSCSVRDEIFSSAMKDWTSKREVDLTSIIHARIEHQIKNNTLNGYGTSEASLTLEKEKSVGGGKGKIDFIISKRHGDDHQSKKSVVMIMEFGLNHNIWWQKFGQILKYVELMLTEAESNYIIDQPVLLTVITVSTGSDTSNDNPVARYGMFLCIPKEKKKQYRLALLWRADTFCLNDASKQFGKILFVAQRCADLREYFTMKPEFETTHQYLGPNCCRIGQLVSF